MIVECMKEELRINLEKSKPIPAKSLEAQPEGSPCFPSLATEHILICSVGFIFCREVLGWREQGG